MPFPWSITWKVTVGPSFVMISSTGCELSEWTTAFSSRLMRTCSMRSGSMGIISISSGAETRIEASGRRFSKRSIASETTSSTISCSLVTLCPSPWSLVTDSRFSTMLSSQLESSLMVVISSSFSPVLSSAWFSI